MILNFGYICMELLTFLDVGPKLPAFVKAQKSYISPGGAAFHQSVAAARSGAKVALVGAIGNDTFGQTILDRLRTEGIQPSGIIRRDIQTGIVNTLVSPDEKHAVVSSAGANGEAKAEQIPETAIHARSFVMIQNDMPVALNLDVIQRAKKRGAKTILCAYHNENLHESLWSDLDFLVTRQSYNIDVTDTDVIHLRLKNASLGGVTIGNETYKRESASKKSGNPHIFNSFCGTLAACLQAGTPLEQAVEYGMSAANLKAAMENPADYPYLDDIKKNLD
ncbi:MAG: hypothetical protein GC137_09475 [Alphaproteobacteria bacterium]|nr:hypothetical protein [Alphaproteobacteria bacterium]